VFTPPPLLREFQHEAGRSLLGGIAYDQVFAASGSQTQNGVSADIKAGGSLLAGSLWFGIGGYVL
jgi:hypothetical protein